MVHSTGANNPVLRRYVQPVASTWAEEKLASAVAEGITDGKRPQAYAIRQEVAIMVERKQ